MALREIQSRGVRLKREALRSPDMGVRDEVSSQFGLWEKEKTQESMKGVAGLWGAAGRERRVEKRCLCAMEQIVLLDDVRGMMTGKWVRQGKGRQNQ